MSKNNSFQFLKFYASFCVLVGHVSWHMSAPILGYEDGPLKPFYHLGVPIFYLISAFFLYPSYSKMAERGVSIKDYLYRRLAKIAPSIYLVSIVAVLIFLALGAINLSDFSDVGFLAWVASVAVLYPVFNPETFSHIGVGVINGSLWSIAALTVFYYSIPLLYKIEKKYSFKLMINSFFVFSVATILILQFLKSEAIFGWSYFQFSFFPNAIFFALGIYWSRNWKERFNKNYLFLISLFLVVLVKTDGSFFDDTLGELNTLLWALPYSFLLIWFGYNAPGFFRSFNKIDDLGMGIYAWHLVVINTLMYLNFNSQNDLPNIVVQFTVILITICLAYLSRNLVEKPISKRLLGGDKKSKVAIPSEINVR